MNKRIKASWVKQLRSGKFTQGKQYLRNGKGENTRYCCLGVLTAMAVKEGGVCPASVAYPAYETLHREVYNWAELVDSNPSVVGKNGIKVKLSALNDSGRSFEYIADLIESKL